MPSDRRVNANGWPLCPQCGEDELYSLSTPADPGKIDGCYRCGKPAPRCSGCGSGISAAAALTDGTCGGMGC